MQKGKTVPGRHEPLISQGTFDRVQAVLDAHRQGGLRAKYRTHYLAGTAFYGKCGARLAHAPHKARNGTYYEYFSCLSRCRDSGACGARYVPNEQVEAVVRNLHRRQWLSDEETTALREAFTSYVEARTERARAEKDRHSRLLAELKNQQKKLLQLYYRDAITEDLLEEEQQRIRREEAEVSRWSDVIGASADDLKAALDEALQLMSLPLEIYDRSEPDVRRLINQAIFERIELWLDPDVETFVVLDDEFACAWEELVPSTLHRDVDEVLGARARLQGFANEIRLLAALLAEERRRSGSAEVRTSSTDEHCRRPPIGRPSSFSGRKRRRAPNPPV